MWIYYYSLYANNGFTRDDMVTVSPQNDVVVHSRISFRSEDQLKYILYIVYERDNYNVTIDAFPFRRIPPSALKSLIG